MENKREDILDSGCLKFPDSFVVVDDVNELAELLEVVDVLNAVAVVAVVVVVVPVVLLFTANVVVVVVAVIDFVGLPGDINRRFTVGSCSIGSLIIPFADCDDVCCLGEPPTSIEALIVRING